jgi:hypothetical protein
MQIWFPPFAEYESGELVHTVNDHHAPYAPPGPNMTITTRAVLSSQGLSETDKT